MTSTFDIIVPVVIGVHHGRTIVDRTLATAIAVDGEKQCIILGPPLVAERLADLLREHGLMNVPDGVEA